MVKTRRQNGVAIKPPTFKASEDEEYEMDDDFAPKSSDEETNKKKRKSRKTNATPKGKRQKTEPPSKSKAANKGATAKGGRRRKTLSLLPTMPLDVLFEIFKHLFPKDLINLARTSTAFEKTMSDPRTSTVWIAARRVFDAPDPAKGFTEAQWGELLFGNTCERCGAKNIQDVDWNILKRTCSSCKISHLLGAKDKDFNRTFVGYPSEIFDCLPNTNIRPWTKETYDPDYEIRKMYWTPDAHEMAKEWNSQRAAAESSPEASEAFDTWRKERKAIVQANSAMVATYKEWYESYLRDKGNEKYEGTKKRLEAAKLRLLNEGHSQVDIDNSIFTFTDGIRTGTPNISNSGASSSI
ncbi:hypothetical protein EST38_g2173 [Candolleomyces aberdarensis]|uniref:F-box domain-containing protein n=1 Tax=Candolleomyces aberdarensis TaxID=2316362 RepID=A0A4Q2DT62_9AGAR|nr:hypothetical protein EST38_g2173 [Candolleomyces aberdarensis]